MSAIRERVRTVCDYMAVEDYRLNDCQHLESPVLNRHLGADGSDSFAN